MEKASSGTIRENEVPPQSDNGAERPVPVSRSHASSHDSSACIQARRAAAQNLAAGEWTYFFEAVGLNRIKIGTTVGVRSRHQSLTNACPVPLRILLVLPGDRYPERTMHERFKADRLHGEWFTASAELRRFIAASRNLQNIPAAVRAMWGAVLFT